MNLKAIVASLVLASSSAAIAAPAATVSVNANASYGTTVVRDHRAPAPEPVHTLPAPAQPTYQSPPIWRKPVRRPVTLASGVHFANGRTVITVANQARQFGSLQITGAGGRTLIQQVAIQFNNGQTQLVKNLNATLTGSDSVKVDLDGNLRSIKRVVVYGKNINNGWQRSQGAFTVLAV
jgi:hypothetical protein